MTGGVTRPLGAALQWVRQYLDRRSCTLCHFGGAWEGRRTAGRVTGTSPGSGPRSIVAARADHVPVPTPGVFDRAFLSLVVDIDNAEPLAVSVGPFEVVQERPQEVPAHICPLAPGVLERRDVPFDIIYPVFVVHAVAAERVLERSAVLGDDERKVREPFVDPDEEFGETRRIDVPPHLRVRRRFRKELYVSSHPRVAAAVSPRARRFV